MSNPRATDASPCGPAPQAVASEDDTPTRTLESERDGRRDQYPVHRTVTTRWADVDIYGHLNNVVHYSLFDTAINGWLIETCGLDIRTLPAIGLVVETQCQYLAELHFPQTVAVGLRLARLGNSSVEYRLALFGDGSSPAAVGRFVHVYVDRQTRRPARVPAPIRNALELLRPLG